MTDQPLTRERIAEIEARIVTRIGSEALREVARELTYDEDAARTIVHEEVRELLARVQGDGWQPIETAPEGCSVLAWQPNWPRIVVANRGTSARWNSSKWFTNGGGTSAPTHWMPLPLPPADGREK